jgi:molybdate transport system ATP-binding protein
MSERDIIRVAFRGRLGQFALDAAFALQRLASGFCAIAGDVWQDGPAFRPTHRRPIGYVFQEPSLFAHLSVRRNLLYGAPRRQQADGSGGVGFDEVTDLLALAPLLDRAPQNLSGGERQRVAIGRALLSQPKLLLMDEPLSALDRATKDEILPFLERLHDRVSLPVIYVTHDMAELEQLADHLVLMRSGQVIAAGALNELQSDPALPLAAGRDAAVTLDAVVEGYDASYGLAALVAGTARFVVPTGEQPATNRRRLRISASDVSLAREKPLQSTILNILPARVVAAHPVSAQEIVAVLSLAPSGSGPRLLARVTRRSWEQLGLAEGAEVFAQIKSVALAPATKSRP